MTDYRHARCIAITRAGKRCSGRWASASACLLAFDSLTGDSNQGQQIVLCHRHRHWVRGPPIRAGVRFRAVRGWLGAANEHGNGTSVFERPTGWEQAPWWWARRRTMKFGESRRDAP